MSSLPNKVYAKISINTGSQINVCVGCSLSLNSNNPSIFWEDWQVNLIAYECQIQSNSISTLFLDIS